VTETVLDAREYVIQLSENNGQSWRQAPGHAYRNQEQATAAAQKLAADKRNRGMTFRLIEVRQTWTVAAEITRPMTTQEPDRFQPGQRIVVGNGTVQTVVKMAARVGNEPLRVEVEGGLQWLADDCGECNADES